MHSFAWLLSISKNYKKNHPYIIKREDVLRFASTGPYFLQNWHDRLETFTKLYYTNAWWVYIQTCTEAPLCGFCLRQKPAHQVSGFSPTFSNFYHLEFWGKSFSLKFFQLTSKDDVSGTLCAPVKNLWVNGLNFVCLKNEKNQLQARGEQYIWRWLSGNGFILLSPRPVARKWNISHSLH